MAFEKLKPPVPKAAAKAKISYSVSGLTVSLRMSLFEERGIDPPDFVDVELDAGAGRLRLTPANEPGFRACVFGRGKTLVIRLGRDYDWLPDFPQKSAPCKFEMTDKAPHAITIDLPVWYRSEDAAGAAEQDRRTAVARRKDWASHGRTDTDITDVTGELMGDPAPGRSAGG